jgi:hypothetical protein
MSVTALKNIKILMTKKYSFETIGMNIVFR